jgi:hypothetical protein
MANGALQTRRRRMLGAKVLLAFCMVALPYHNAAAFVVRPNHYDCSTRYNSNLKMFTDNEGDDDKPISGDSEFIEEFKSRAESFEVEKMRDRLEEDNTQSFLKRRPRKLPYEDARRWVQGNLGPNTKEEFDDLVENGNLRTPYIPKKPEDYYTRTREWVSWDHFLKGVFDNENPSGVRPASGIFD